MEHIKLIGGSVNTARHDLEKIKTAKEEVRKLNKYESDRSAVNRKKEASADIDWTDFKSNW